MLRIDSCGCRINTRRPEETTDGACADHPDADPGAADRSDPACPRLHARPIIPAKG
ncbi:hypothetical protein [Kitasatospora sp. NPDC093102]|uniref:hypothetical protein n=1 Tax=Kitasatospora sp. NPDC093102 TaxID=3155069 RepID=UPI003426F577